MAQEYTVEQLNHGRKVWDFMRWDYWAFGISGFLLIVSIAIIGVRGFNWGLDFTGGTVIEITLEKPVDLDQMRDSLQKAGFEEPQVQNFGSSRDIMVRMPPVHDANGSQELGSKVVTVINESTSQNAAVKRIEFVGPSVGADLAQTGALALIAALVCILIYVGRRGGYRPGARRGDHHGRAVAVPYRDRPDHRGLVDVGYRLLAERQYRGIGPYP